MLVHAGVLDHHNDLWQDRQADDATSSSRLELGLGQWLRHHVETEVYNPRRPLRKVLCVGLSLGGAVAQLSALRLATQLPWIAVRLRPLASRPLPPSALQPAPRVCVWPPPLPSPPPPPPLLPK